MNRLSLNALNLSTAEHLLYTQAFHELAEVPEDHHESVVRDPGDYYAHTALSIPEVRRWLGDHFCTISLGQIDQVGSCHVLQLEVVDTWVSGRSYRRRVCKRAHQFVRV